jgi:hypothetical protein
MSTECGHKGKRAISPSTSAKVTCSKPLGHADGVHRGYYEMAYSLSHYHGGVRAAFWDENGATISVAVVERAHRAAQKAAAK